MGNALGVFHNVNSSPSSARASRPCLDLYYKNLLGLLNISVGPP